MDESAGHAARWAAIKHVHPEAAVDERPLPGRYLAQRHGASGRTGTPGPQPKGTSSDPCPYRVIYTSLKRPWLPCCRAAGHSRTLCSILVLRIIGITSVPAAWRGMIQGI